MGGWWIGMWFVNIRCSTHWSVAAVMSWQHWPDLFSCGIPIRVIWQWKEKQNNLNIPKHNLQYNPRQKPCLLGFYILVISMVISGRVSKSCNYGDFIVLPHLGVQAAGNMTQYPHTVKISRSWANHSLLYPSLVLQSARLDSVKN